MSASPQACSAQEPAQSPRSLLRPGFTAINNRLFEAMRTLSGAEKELLFLLVRQSNGFLRRDCILGETFLVNNTSLSRASLYRAKESLQEQGLISVTPTHQGSRYLLADHLQSVKSEAELHSAAPVKSPTRAARTQHLSAVPDNSPSQNETPHPSHFETPYKEHKENKEKKEQQTSQPIATTPAPTQVCPLPTGCDDASNGSRSSPALLQDAPLGEMLRKLCALGIQAHVAQKLASTQSLDVIQQAIGRAEVLKPRNPAGFVVSELQRGGYGAPSGAAPDPNQALRIEREQIAALRAAEREQEKLKAEASHQRTQSWLQQFQQLPPTHQALIRAQMEQQATRENFTRMTGWGEQHPVWLALLAEVMQQSSG